MPLSPAIIKIATWDVVGWNIAATALLTDYARLPREGRNILRLMFNNPCVRGRQENWKSVSSFAVEGRPELGMIVYNPASPADAERLRALIEAKAP